jgi:hypothetical protein
MRIIFTTQHQHVDPLLASLGVREWEVVRRQNVYELLLAAGYTDSANAFHPTWPPESFEETERLKYQGETEVEILVTAWNRVQRDTLQQAVGTRISWSATHAECDRMTAHMVLPPEGARTTRNLSLDELMPWKEETPIAMPPMRSAPTFIPCDLCRALGREQVQEACYWGIGCCEQHYCHDCYPQCHYQTEEEYLAAGLEYHTIIWSFFFNFG